MYCISKKVNNFLFIIIFYKIFILISLKNMGFGNTKCQQSSEDIQEHPNYDAIFDQQNQDEDLYNEVKGKINQDELGSIETIKNEKKKEVQKTCINVEDSKIIHKSDKSKIIEIKKKGKKKVSNKKKQKKKIYDSSWTLHLKQLKKNLIVTKNKNKIIIKRKCFEKISTYKFIKSSKMMRKAHKIRIILTEKNNKKIVSLVSLINRKILVKNQKENRNDDDNNSVHTINNETSINDLEEFNDLDICNNIVEERDPITRNIMSIISLINTTDV